MVQVPRVMIRQKKKPALVREGRCQELMKLQTEKSAHLVLFHFLFHPSDVAGHFLGTGLSSHFDGC